MSEVQHLYRGQRCISVLDTREVIWKYMSSRDDNGLEKLCRCPQYVALPLSELPAPCVLGYKVLRLAIRGSSSPSAPLQHTHFKRLWTRTYTL